MIKTLIVAPRIGVHLLLFIICLGLVVCRRKFHTILSLASVTSFLLSSIYISLDIEQFIVQFHIEDDVPVIGVYAPPTGLLDIPTYTLRTVFVISVCESSSECKWQSQLLTAYTTDINTGCGFGGAFCSRGMGVGPIIFGANSNRICTRYGAVFRCGIDVHSSASPPSSCFSPVAVSINLPSPTPLPYFGLLCIFRPLFYFVL